MSLFALFCLGLADAMAQRPALPKVFVNGNFEELNASGLPVGWSFPQGMLKAGYKAAVDAQGGINQSKAAMLSFAGETLPPRASFNLNQVIDPSSMRGKRVRFRAAVRTADLGADSKALLWFRVDSVSPSGQSRIGAFDNMDDRPIRGSEWQHYEIVGQIAPDATNLNMGLILVGSGKAWIDDASLEVVADDTPTTARDSGVVRPAKTNVTNAAASRPAIDSQPFLVKWLWLVAVALGLFALSQIKPRPDQRLLGHAERFAFRFSFAYWLLYSLPQPFTSIVPMIGGMLGHAYATASKAFVRWTAVKVFDLTQLPPPRTGSGDTQDDFIRLFICFAIAILIALVWSLLDRRKTRHSLLNDLLRSYLRYVLALTLLGYGLAKTGQFRPLQFDQLITTFGDSSPMGLLWKFMGASQTYTIFAGLGEVVAALLLLWRRTTILGACVAAGVMANVVMMNYCYDVPVKQYSTHLLVMAIFILLPDFQRLANVMFWHRPTEAAELRPTYPGTRTVWVQRAFKLYVVIFCFGLPLSRAFTRPMRASESESGIFGGYEVESMTTVRNSPRWQYLSLRRIQNSDSFTIRLANGAPVYGTLTMSPDGKSLTLQNRYGAAMPATVTVRVVDSDHLSVSEEGLEVRFKRKRREDFPLLQRGFHWTTELPYNR